MRKLRSYLSMSRTGDRTQPRSGGIESMSPLRGWDYLRWRRAIDRVVIQLRERAQWREF